MNYHKIEKYSIANGSGVRCVLWVSGCSLHCKGCQNPSTWDFNSGKPFGPKEWQEVYDALKKPYIQGITFSGGHPLEEENRPTIFSLILDIKRLFPHKDIWLYTGYELNIGDFYGSSTKEAILRLCDVVVDGPYIEEQRDISLPFCGSRNQRLIDVKESLKQGKIVTLQND
jgi:anaerobic ribonucleoside-triphosphate reductase activating protein